MHNLKVWLCFVLMVISATKVGGSDTRVGKDSYPAIAFKKFLTKLEAIEKKLVDIESAAREDRESVDTSLSNAINQIDQQLNHLGQNFSALQIETNLAVKEQREFIKQKMKEITNAISISETNTSVVIKKELEVMQQNLSRVNGTLNRLCETTDNKLTTLVSQSKQTEEIVKEKHKQMWQNIDKLSSKHDASLVKTDSGLYCQSNIVTSCKENPWKRSGIYLIQPTDKNDSFMGYCDQIVFGGGWLVFQYRYDGSVDFYRNWTEYRNGFGSLDGEFWFGLEQLHQLTSARKHELLVELKDFDGNYVYARYDEFHIGSEGEQYKLDKLGAYSGTAGNSLQYHEGKMFSTNDRHNSFDELINCPVFHMGAWWYYGCGYSNLNGHYMKGKDQMAMYWFEYKKSFLGLAYSRMLIREIGYKDHL